MDTRPLKFALVAGTIAMSSPLGALEPDPGIPIAEQIRSDTRIGLDIRDDGQGVLLVTTALGAAPAWENDRYLAFRLAPGPLLKGPFDVTPARPAPDRYRFAGVALAPDGRFAFVETLGRQSAKRAVQMQIIAQDNGRHDPPVLLSEFYPAPTDGAISVMADAEIETTSEGHWLTSWSVLHRFATVNLGIASPRLESRRVLTQAVDGDGALLAAAQLIAVRPNVWSGATEEGPRLVRTGAGVLAAWPMAYPERHAALAQPLNTVGVPSGRARRVDALLSAHARELQLGHRQGLTALAWYEPAYPAETGLRVRFLDAAHRPAGPVLHPSLPLTLSNVRVHDVVVTPSDAAIVALTASIHATDHSISTGVVLFCITPSGALACAPTTLGSTGHVTQARLKRQDTDLILAYADLGLSGNEVGIGWLHRIPLPEHLLSSPAAE